MKKFTFVFKMAITAVIGYTVYRFLKSRAPKPARLFFYTPKNQITGDFPLYNIAKAATVTPNSFNLFNPFQNTPVDYWDFIAPAPFKGKKWIYFRNAERHGLGYIDANYKFILNTYLKFPKQTRGGYLFAIDGRGYILLKDTWIGFYEFAQVFDDGSFVEWWISNKQPQVIASADVVLGLPAAHLLHGTTSETTSVTTILDVKTGNILYSKTWEDPWEGVIINGNVIFFYNTFLVKSQIGYIDQNSQIVITRVLAPDPGLLPTFNRVTSLPGAHLCWGWGVNGGETIRVLNKDGLKIIKYVSFGDPKEDNFFGYVVPC